MRKVVLLFASVLTALALSSGVALALNAISCEGSGIKCVGTNKADLIKGTNGLDLIYAHDKADTLKGFGKGDALLGQRGNDPILGGRGQDFLIGGIDDDTLRGEDALDIYYFERSEWGQDTILDAPPPGNILRLPDREDFDGTITTNLNSDSGPVPEVTNSENTSTVNWSGNVISVVIGSAGNDQVTGNEDANDIFDGEGLEGDTDTITAAGGNDLIDVQDGAGDDTVDCGEDAGDTDDDTVYCDEGDVITNCEQQNPI